MTQFFKNPSKLDLLKCAKVFSLENVELEKIKEDGKLTFSTKGTLKVLYFESRKTFALKIAHWLYILSPEIPIEVVDDQPDVHLYALPAVEGIFALKISKKTDVGALFYFETILSNAGRFNREGSLTDLSNHNPHAIGLMKAHSFGLLEDVKESSKDNSLARQGSMDSITDADLKMRKRDKLKKGFMKVAEKFGGRSNSKPEIGGVQERYDADGRGHECCEFDRAQFEQAVYMSTRIIKNLDYGEEKEAKNEPKGKVSGFIGAMKDSLTEIKEKITQKLGSDKEIKKEMSYAEYIKEHPEEVIVYKTKEEVKPKPAPSTTSNTTTTTTCTAITTIAPKIPMASAEYRPGREVKRALSVISEKEEEGNLGDSLIKSRRNPLLDSFEGVSTPPIIESPATAEIEVESFEHEDHHVPKVKVNNMEKPSIFMKEAVGSGGAHHHGNSTDAPRATNGHGGIVHTQAHRELLGARHLNEDREGLEKAGVVQRKNSQECNKENLGMAINQSIVRNHKSEPIKRPGGEYSEQLGSIAAHNGGHIDHANRFMNEKEPRSLMDRIKSKLSLLGKSFSSDTHERREQYWARNEVESRGSHGRQGFNPIVLNSPNTNKTLTESPMLHPGFEADRVTMSYVDPMISNNASRLRKDIA